MNIAWIKPTVTVTGVFNIDEEQQITGKLNISCKWLISNKNKFNFIFNFLEKGVDYWANDITASYSILDEPLSVDGYSDPAYAVIILDTTVSSNNSILIGEDGKILEYDGGGGSPK